MWTKQVCMSEIFPKVSFLVKVEFHITKLYTKNNKYLFIADVNVKSILALLKLKLY